MSKFLHTNDSTNKHKVKLGQTVKDGKVKKNKYSIPKDPSKIYKIITDFSGIIKRMLQLNYKFRTKVFKKELSVPITLLIKELTLSQMTNFRRFQTEKVYRRQF